MTKSLTTDRGKGMVRLILLITLFHFTVGQPPCIFADTPTVEVLHFWEQPSEKNALDILANNYRLTGGKWFDTVVTNEKDLRISLSNQIVKGYPPTLFQWHGGMELLDLAEQGNLNWFPLSVLDTPNAIPPFVIDSITYKNQLVAIPLGLHTENWMWYNLHIYKELNLELPSSWQQFIEQADIISEAGYIPLAIGDRWQHQLLFNTILAGELDRDGYIDFFINKNSEQILSEEFYKSIDTYLLLQKYLVLSNRTQSWRSATDLVINNRAAAQCMGDWAKVAFLEAGKKLGIDFSCIPAPQTDSSLIIVIDVLAFAKITTPQYKQYSRILQNLQHLGKTRRNSTGRKDPYPSDKILIFPTQIAVPARQ